MLISQEVISKAEEIADQVNLQAVVLIPFSDIYIEYYFGKETDGKKAS